MGGAARQAIGANQGIGGDTIAQLQARLNYTYSQVADITVVAIGHNSLSLGSATCITQLGTMQSTLRTNLGASKRIVWTTVLPSVAFPPADATLVAVNNYIKTLNNTDGGYTTVCDTASGFDYTTMTYNVAGDVNIHPNEIGAKYVAGLLQTHVTPFLTTSLTTENVLDQITAASYYGADAHPAQTHNITGTAGTLAGTTLPTGSVGSSFTVTNNSTCAVACSIDAQSGYNRQIIDITGTASAEATIVLSVNNVAGSRAAINAVAGDTLEALCGAALSHTDGTSAPVGLLSYGLVMPTNTASYMPATYTGADTKNVTGDGALTALTVVAAQTGVIKAYPKTTPVAANNMQLSFGVRVKAGTVNVRLIFWKPILRKVELVAYAAPVYLGSDGIMAAAERLQFSVIPVNAVASTIWCGTWSGGNLTHSQTRIYKGTVSDTGIGSGTLIATLGAGASPAYTPSGLTTGDYVWIERDVTNSFGTTTARSAGSGPVA